MDEAEVRKQLGPLLETMVRAARDGKDSVWICSYEPDGRIERKHTAGCICIGGAPWQFIIGTAEAGQMSVRDFILSCLVAPGIEGVIEAPKG